LYAGIFNKGNVFETISGQDIDKEALVINSKGIKNHDKTEVQEMEGVGRKLARGQRTLSVIIEV
jgi:hypothetical protein